MFKIDTTTAVASEPAPAAPGTPGWFTDGNPLTNTAATIVSADWLNMVQGELLNVVTAAGLTPTKGVENQLLASLDRLIEAKTGNYAVDTGTANAYVIGLTPPVLDYSESFSFTFRAIHANTGASTIDCGPGPVPLDRDDGTALQQGDIPANAIVSGIYDHLVNQARVTALVPSQLGLLAKMNIGAGLKDDGSGGLTLKLADATIRVTGAGAQVTKQVHAYADASPSADDLNQSLIFPAVGTGVTIDLPSDGWQGLSFTAYPFGSPMRLVPSAGQQIILAGASLGAGIGWDIPIMAAPEVIFDGNGNWIVPVINNSAANAAVSNGAVEVFVAAVDGACTVGHAAVFSDTNGTISDGGPANAASAPTYINSSQTLGAGRFAVDTATGAITVTINPAALVDGDSMEFMDVSGTWSQNNMTIVTAGLTISIVGQTPVAGPIICDVSGEAFLLRRSGTTLIIF